MQPTTPTQMTLELPAEADPLLMQAQRLFRRSALLQRRWPSFEAAMADPLMGKSLRTAAKGLLRNQELKNNKKGLQREVRWKRAGR